MFGAMIGDITGSRFEFSNIKTKDFELFSKDCFFTDDTVMTVAVAKAAQDPQKHADQLKKEFVKQMCDLPCPHRKLQRRDTTVYRKQLLSAGYAA